MKKNPSERQNAPITADSYRQSIAYDPANRVSTTSRTGAMAFSAAMFVVPAAVVIALTWSISSIWTVGLALLVGLLFALTVHMAYEWERAVIVRFGKFNRIAGPGIYLTIPIIESQTALIDQRIRTISFDAEETLSSDLVPVNVDTVLFWVVWDVERACKEVRNYEAVISLAAQTAMRDVIGQICVSEIAMRRSYLDEELKRIISEKVGDWGIEVVSVEIRDIVIPKELQQDMSAEARAEREKDARIVLAEVERDIAAMLHDASEIYREDDIALKLRQMHLLNEGIKESRGTMVVPSAYTEGFTEDKTAGAGA